MRILQGHAVDLLPTIGPLDLVCTDPPYAFGGSGAEQELSATVAITLRESAKLLKRGRWMVVFAASSWRSTYYMVEAVRGVLDPVRIATWCKPNATSKARTPGWNWASVNVLAFRKGKSESFPAFDRPDFIVEPAVRNGRRAQLPDAVADWAVAPYAFSGGTMLDPFAGSGVLVTAAERRGMYATGFDLNPDYVTVKRMALEEARET